MVHHSRDAGWRNLIIYRQMDVVNHFQSPFVVFVHSIVHSI